MNDDHRRAAPPPEKPPPDAAAIEPRPIDVLCGRGKPVQDHEGNIR